MTVLRLTIVKRSIIFVTMFCLLSSTVDHAWFVDNMHFNYIFIYFCNRVPKVNFYAILDVTESDFFYYIHSHPRMKFLTILFFYFQPPRKKPTLRVQNRLNLYTHVNYHPIYCKYIIYNSYFDAWTCRYKIPTLINSYNKTFCCFIKTKQIWLSSNFISRRTMETIGNH